jgi:phospholipase C
MIFTDPHLDGYVFWAQDRERNVWSQIVKDRRGVVVGSLGTWREATTEEIASGKDHREVTFKVAADCPCAKSQVTYKLIQIE